MSIFFSLFGNLLRCKARAFARVCHWFLQLVCSLLGVGGRFAVECVAPDGTVRWTAFAKNGVTGAGLDDLLNTYFRNGTPKTAWYIGLIDNASYSSMSSSDTMSSHPGWVESAAYTNANRVQWSPGASSGQSVVNGTTCDFSMNAVKSIRGLFLASDNTISGTSGLLWATAPFTGGTQSVNPGDTLKVTYTVSGVSG
jgi:hypothetical protein